ncbi:MAG: ubiquitin-conjugating enzyme E2 variant [Promethearchaeota archaeon]
MINADFILAREAQLMYQRAKEFKPVNGNLRHWKGFLPGRGAYAGMKFEIDIYVPYEFPRKPPEVWIRNVKHPNVDAQGKLRMHIVESGWRGDFHIYHVVNSFKGLFARAPLAPAGIMPPQPSKKLEEETVKFKQQSDLLESEVERLQSVIINKDEELARLKARMTVHNVPESGEVHKEGIIQPTAKTETLQMNLESEKIAIVDLIENLETKFREGEIAAVEYTKLYKKYSKELYLINKKLEDSKK